jgi:hypothetical protein
MSAEWAARPTQPIQLTSTNKKILFAHSEPLTDACHLKKSKFQWTLSVPITWKLTVMWRHMVIMALRGLTLSILIENHTLTARFQNSYFLVQNCLFKIMTARSNFCISWLTVSSMEWRLTLSVLSDFDRKHSLQNSPQIKNNSHDAFCRLRLEN